MKKIEITEKNYDAYKEFDRLNNSPIGVFPLASIREEIYFIILGISSVVLPMMITSMALSFFSSLFTIWIIGFISSMYFNFLITNKIIRKMNMKTFQKEYPDFDIAVDVKEVAKELEKYEELSKIPKNIEKEKEEHLSNLPSNVKEMSTEDKLAYLEHEREFWEKVAIQEKYGNIGDSKEIGRQKSLS